MTVNKPEHRKFTLNMRGHFFTVRVTEHCLLEVLKTHLDAILCNVLGVILLGRGVGLDDLQRSLPTSAIL